MTYVGQKVQTLKYLSHFLSPQLYSYLCAGNFSTILLLILCAFK